MNQKAAEFNFTAKSVMYWILVIACIFTIYLVVKGVIGKLLVI